MKPWQDESKPIMIGVRPHAWFFDEPMGGALTVEVLEVAAVLADLQQRAEAAEARQQRTADYAQHWRREAERSGAAANAYRDGKEAATQLAVMISNGYAAELEDLRHRVEVLTEALAKAEAALGGTTVVK